MNILDNILQLVAQGARPAHPVTPTPMQFNGGTPGQGFAQTLNGQMQAPEPYQGPRVGIGMPAVPEQPSPQMEATGRNILAGLLGGGSATGSIPQPQPAQPMAHPGLASLFGGSQQLANADPSQGIMPTLLNPTSNTGPAPVPQGYTPPAQGGAWGDGSQPVQQPSLLDRFSAFTNSPRGQALNDIFTGWAMGSTPQQSLGLGAQLASEHGQTRTQQNQTIQWLQSQGVSKDEATALAGNPTLLSAKLRQMQAPQAADTYRTLTTDEAQKMGLPEGGTYQMQSNGHITKIGGNGLAGGDLSQGDAASMAKSIIDGTMDPNLPGFYHNKATVYAEVKKLQPDFNIAKASQTYKADSRYFASMNSSQQLRIRQNMDTLTQSLPMVKQLADQWDAGKFKPLNAATLALAVQGGMGPKAQSIATQLQHQISQVNAELAGVFMGGNSPTDAAFKLAQHSLSGDWSAQTLRDNLKLIDENLLYRRNALTNAGAVEPGGTASYGVAPHVPEAQPPAVPAYGRGGPADAVPAPAAAPTAPAVGTIEGGYRFKGGNPADQNSWEKVQ